MNADGRVAHGFSRGDLVIVGLSIPASKEAGHQIYTDVQTIPAASGGAPAWVAWVCRWDMGRLPPAEAFF